MPKVASEMTHRVAVVTEDEPLERAKVCMESLNVRHVPVVRNGLVVGILSDRDILLHSLPNSFGQPAISGQKWVRDVMNRVVVTCRETDSIGKCVDALLSHRIDCLPVVDDDGYLKGILTTTDLLHLLREQEGAQNRPLPIRWETFPLGSQPKGTA